MRAANTDGDILARADGEGALFELRARCFEQDRAIRVGMGEDRGVRCLIEANAGALQGTGEEHVFDHTMSQVVRGEELLVRACDLDLLRPHHGHHFPLARSAGGTWAMKAGGSRAPTRAVRPLARQNEVGSPEECCYEAGCRPGIEVLR